MKILGFRVLVSKVEETKSEGFQTVEVQDSFIYKGKVEQLGDRIVPEERADRMDVLRKGAIVYFSKYSPDTQEIEYEGKTMKIISESDILAVL